MTFREHDVESGPHGLRLRVCAWGDDDGRPPVLILHGYLEQGAAWDAVAARLGRRALAPDHRGHGRSEHVGRGGAYYFWDYVRDADAIADHAGGRVDVVGHSMGGTIASLLAATRPEKVRRLVLVEGLAVPDGRPEAMQRARAFLDDRASPPGHPIFAAPEDAARRLRRVTPGMPDDVALALARRVLREVGPDEPGGPGWTWTWDARHRGRTPVPFNPDLHATFLAQIACPTLLVDGALSPWRPPWAAERARLIPDARALEIAGAGHMIHHDAPDALARAIVEHLDAGAPG